MGPSRDATPKRRRPNASCAAPLSFSLAFAFAARLFLPVFLWYPLECPLLPTRGKGATGLGNATAPTAFLVHSRVYSNRTRRLGRPGREWPPTDAPHRRLDASRAAVGRRGGGGGRKRGRGRPTSTSASPLSLTPSRRLDVWECGVSHTPVRPTASPPPTDATRGRRRRRPGGGGHRTPIQTAAPPRHPTAFPLQAKNLHGRAHTARHRRLDRPRRAAGQPRPAG